MVAGLLASATATVQAAVIYFNQGVPQNSSRFNPGTREAGDEITLGGPVTGGVDADHAIPDSFNFNMWAQGYTGMPVIQGQVRFYANDGPLIGAAHQPGTLLWDSTIFPIQLQTSGGTPILNPTDITLYNIAFTTDLAGVVLPKSFTWSAQFSDLQGGSAGLLFNTPPLVGNNFTDYWLKNGSWSLMGGGGTTWDFDAAMTGVAVPEPAPMLTIACVLALGGFVAWRSRSKRQVAA